MDKDDAGKEIMKYVMEMLPTLPEPVEVKGHKWRYSQVRVLLDLLINFYDTHQNYGLDQIENA